MFLRFTLSKGYPVLPPIRKNEKGMKMLSEMVFVLFMFSLKKNY